MLDRVDAFTSSTAEIAGSSGEQDKGIELNFASRHHESKSPPCYAAQSTEKTIRSLFVQHGKIQN
jgi:hypothetical protein